MKKYLLCFTFLAVLNHIQAAPTQSFPSSIYCGPLSCYVALKYLGIECTLEDITESCRYDNAPVEISAIYKTLKSYPAITCSIRDCDPQEIKKYLSIPGSVLLLVFNAKNKDDINHIVVLLSKDKEYILVDYPNVIHNYNLANLPGTIAAKCIVARRSNGSLDYIDGRQISVMIAGLLIIAAAGILLRKKKKLCIVILGVLLSSGVSFGTTLCINEKNESCDIDLGIIDSSEPNIIADVLVKNELNTPILIKDTRVSCSSCIQPLFVPDRIDSQKEEILKFKIITKGRKGIVNAQAFLNGDIASCVFNFRAYIPYVWPETKLLELGNIGLHEVINKEIRLFQVGFPDVKISEITTSSKSISCTQKQPDKEEIDAAELECFGVLQVTFSFSDLQPGMYEETIIMKTNIAEFPQISIPVKGYISGRADLYPSKLLYIVSDPNKPLEQKGRAVYHIPLAAATFDPNAIETTSTLPDNISIKIEECKMTNPENVEITYLALLLLTADKPCPKNAEIIVNYSGKTLFKVPVTIFNLSQKRKIEN